MADSGARPQQNNNISSSLFSTYFDVKQWIDRHIDGPPDLENADDDNDVSCPGTMATIPSGLTAADRKFILRMLLCVVSLICIPLYIVLFLLSSEVGSLTSVAFSIMFLGCCCCIACANVYWMKKENNGYQQIP
eukprot:181547_1